MRTHSLHGGRHELGQNFLTHKPTISLIVDLVAATDGSILEIGSGDGALTTELARLRRNLTAIDIDERRIDALARQLPAVRVERSDVLQHPLHQPVIVGNVPFHLTTPILRRLLEWSSWRDAILLSQWEVARKRAGVGGGTMMTAQAAPWFTFRLHGRVPSHGFRPMPSVDGGVLGITRRRSPLVPIERKRDYQRFVQEVFTRKGRGIAMIVHRITGIRHTAVETLLLGLDVGANGLPRDLTPDQWAALWHACDARGSRGRRTGR